MSTTKTTDCPSWCETHVEFGDEVGPIHQAAKFAPSWADHGDSVAVEALPGDAPAIDVQITSENATPEQCRELAAALLAAADAFERIDPDSKPVVMTCLLCERPDTEVALTARYRCADEADCRDYRTPPVPLSCPPWCMFADDPAHVADAVDGVAGHLLVQHTTNAHDTGVTVTQLVKVDQVTGVVVDVDAPRVELPTDVLTMGDARALLADLAAALRVADGAARAL